MAAYSQMTWLDPALHSFSDEEATPASTPQREASPPSSRRLFPSPRSIDGTDRKLRSEPFDLRTRLSHNRRYRGRRLWCVSTRSRAGEEVGREGVASELNEAGAVINLTRGDFKNGGNLLDNNIRGGSVGLVVVDAAEGSLARRDGAK